MASLTAFVGLATVALLVQAVSCANYAVGGANGWSLTSDLKSWASTQSFKVGDTLTFSYDSQHSIMEVSKPDYDACLASTPIQGFTGGDTGIKLSSPGKRYFICGTAGHCTGGMKVEINTVSAAVSVPPPASPPVTPPITLTPTPPSKAPMVPPPASPPATPPITLTPTPPSKAPMVPPPASPPATPPTTLTPTSPSKAPMVPPRTAPSRSNVGPSLPPSTTDSPTVSPSAGPASDFPGVARTPQKSAASSFSSVVKIGLGLGTSMLMMALVL